jgi:hypothetical protein
MPQNQWLYTLWGDQQSHFHIVGVPLQGGGCDELSSRAHRRDSFTKLQYDRPCPAPFSSLLWSFRSIHMRCLRVRLNFVICWLGSWPGREYHRKVPAASSRGVWSSAAFRDSRVAFCWVAGSSLTRAPLRRNLSRSAAGGAGYSTGFVWSTAAVWSG